MSTKIYAKAKFGFREDSLKNWTENNPILEKGEPAVISDSEDSRWLKIGDGITPFNALPWKFAGGGMADKVYDPKSENAQSGIAVAQALSSFTPKEKNYELIATIKVAPDENGNLPTSIVFTQDSNGNPFELTDFYLSAVVGATDGSSAKIALAINNKQVFGNTNCGISTDLRQWWLNYMNFGAKGSIAIAPSWTVGSKAHATAGNANMSGFAGGVLPPLFSDYLPVTKIDFYIMSGTTKTFIEGSEFKLYGVRK